MPIEQLDPAADVSIADGVPKALSGKVAEAKARVAVDDALYRYRADNPEPASMPPPVFVEEPVAAEQTGDSALLGGAMELKAPWERR